jgi:small subunit ribosomal protein S20
MIIPGNAKRPTSKFERRIACEPAGTHSAFDVGRSAFDVRISKPGPPSLDTALQLTTLSTPCRPVSGGGSASSLETTTVAHSLSANKRVRQTARRNARNRNRKDLLKGAIKGFNTALTANDAGKAGDELNKVAQRLDRNAAKGVTHKNAAARKRSRLTKRLNALKAGAKGAKLATA